MCLETIAFQWRGILSNSVRVMRDVERCGLPMYILISFDSIKTNSDTDKNRYYEPPHAFERTREKIGALMGMAHVQG
jgi:hypothetical protein